MRAEKIVKINLITLLIVLCPYSIFAQANNSISGFVFTTGRSSLPEIPVELQNENYQTISRIRTDGAGRYLFTRISQGRYYIKVLPLGTSFEEQTIEVEIVNIARQSAGGGVTFSASENVQKDFYLRDKRSIRTGSSINAVIFAQEIPPDAKRLYEQAVDDFDDSKKQNEVTDGLVKAIVIFPTYYLALDKLAQQYIKTSEFKNAAIAAAKATEVNPKGFDSWYTLGYANYKLNSPVEAINALSSAVELNPNSVNALFVLGSSLRLSGKYVDAEEKLLKAKKLASAPIAEIHWQLALLYTNNLKKYPEAVKELELFLKANPKFEEAEKVKELIKKLKAK